MTTDYTKEPRLMTIVDTIFQEVCQEIFGDSLTLPPRIAKECQDIKRHGDYQCTAAMAVFGMLKKKKDKTFANPQAIAQAIVDKIGQDHPVVHELQVNGPGFVVCRLRPAFLQQHVNAWLLTTGQLPFHKPEQPPTCIVDFSSPNIAKEMHVGHLRSTIIGESVCRILELVGCDVHRVNHVGDWGTQFGMLIQYLKEEYPQVVGQQGALPNITDLTEFYKCAK